MFSIKFPIIAGVFTICMCGCLSQRDALRLEELRTEVLQKASTKELSLSDADKILAEIKTIYDNNTSSNSMKDILISLGEIALALLGVRIWRGSVNNRKGVIENTTI